MTHPRQLHFRRQAGTAIAVLGLASQSMTAHACDLCAIYNASSAQGKVQSGFLFSIAEQFTHYATEQVEGQERRRARPDRMDRSITHVVATYNFGSSFGLSLNVPVAHRDFERTELRYAPRSAPRVVTEKGGETELGDLAVVGRATVFSKTEMEYGFTANLLAGVKLPTGNTGWLRDEVEQGRIYESLIPAGTPHDPLGHSITSLHAHELSAGSGSVDGVFGITTAARWNRFFFNTAAQYYWRNEGESGFEYGDELLISGGPGGYVHASREWSLGIQALVSYETTARATLLGRVSNRTGMTAWYAGPQLFLTWGRHLSANAGVDVPVDITSNGFQLVPDYRIHAGVAWRF